MPENEDDVVLLALKMAGQGPDVDITIKTRTLARLIGSHELFATALAILYDAANGNPKNTLPEAMTNVQPAAFMARRYLEKRGIVPTKP